MAFWNVPGLKNKDKDFWEGLRTWDIMILMETWVDKKEWEKFRKFLPGGYKWKVKENTDVKPNKEKNMMDSKTSKDLPPQSDRTLRGRHGGSTVPALAASLSNEGQKERLTAGPSEQSATAVAEQYKEKRKADKSLESALQEDLGVADCSFVTMGIGALFDHVSNSLDEPWERLCRRSKMSREEKAGRPRELRDKIVSGLLELQARFTPLRETMDDIQRGVTNVASVVEKVARGQVASERQITEAILQVSEDLDEGNTSCLADLKEIKKGVAGARAAIEEVHNEASRSLHALHESMETSVRAIADVSMPRPEEATCSTPVRGRSQIPPSRLEEIERVVRCTVLGELQKLLERGLPRRPPPVSRKSPILPPVPVRAQTEEKEPRKKRKKKKKKKEKKQEVKATKAPTKGGGTAVGVGRGESSPPLTPPSSSQRPPRGVLPRTEAVTLRPEGESMSYAQVLRDARNKVDPRSVGVSRVRRTLEGHLLLELGGEDRKSKADFLATKLKEALPEGVSVACPSRNVEILVSGLDEFTTEDDLSKEFVAEFGGGSGVRVVSLRRSQPVGGIALVRCPAEAAAKAIRAGRLPVGWVVAKEWRYGGTGEGQSKKSGGGNATSVEDREKEI
ncbi:uncharacterized protein LOC109862177 [Pseudomyrmex gracilis]|uniref:uncharacterized protein LOC109862177 n=1 Tax=Pseudomyrmex gracilis TaxID=219809 RepID=UPI000995175E|nr:uncharacterized protein LOC109862177 [Pseudomyrmex gracilis]